VKTIKASKVFMAIDLGDSHSQVCVVTSNGKTVLEKQVETTKKAFHDVVTGFPASSRLVDVVFEVGTHSPWVERLLKGLVRQVTVCDPAILRRIRSAGEKSDRTDARVLAELLRCHSALLRPVEHRSEELQVDWTLLNTRDALIACRTKLINSFRGSVKTMGERLPKSITSAAFANKVKDLIPEKLRAVLEPLRKVIEAVNDQIDDYDKAVTKCVNKKYVAAKKLAEIDGVGPITALAFVLVVFNAKRFRHTRSIGKYIGLTPKLDQSGTIDPQLGITKAGNPMLRKLLVQCAHQILGPFGKDCDLRTWGLALASRGGKNAKKRAVIAVARRLATKILAIWKSGVPYDPTYDAKLAEQRLRKAS
jgi:transposase